MLLAVDGYGFCICRVYNKGFKIRVVGVNGFLYLGNSFPSAVVLGKGYNGVVSVLGCADCCNVFNIAVFYPFYGKNILFL